MSARRQLGAAALVLGAVLLAGPSTDAVDGGHCMAWCQLRYHECMILWGGYGSGGAGWGVCNAELTECFAICARLVVATNKAAPPSGGGDGSPLERFLRDVAAASEAPSARAVSRLLPRSGLPRPSLGKHGTPAIPAPASKLLAR